MGYHTFRHTLATLLGSLHVNVKTTQELLRHANPVDPEKLLTYFIINNIYELIVV